MMQGQDLLDSSFGLNFLRSLAVLYTMIIKLRGQYRLTPFSRHLILVVSRGLSIPSTVFHIWTLILAVVN